ncbi:tetratricopeptide repeat protein [Vannielia litorea]|uniref:tetratricopeptide repeat protein n=1 Tax=Vannielia litorea TaxID=1217970 RepID=UPI001C96E0C3|nr:tetratricopeptide repeat protein [Vannielia litorea]MBY6046013.1 tetratricopeptide repeat protein [Vannielia litorea]MBY6073426.1 tetratricopeptide repeat protein [Vannielia litorea]
MIPSLLRSAAAIALAVSTALPAAAQQADRGLAGSYLAARVASFNNDFRAAADYYTRALVRDRENALLMENAILAFAGLADFNAAVPIARQMVDTVGESQIARLVLMSDQLSRQQYQEVLDGLAEGQTVGPLVDGLVRAWSELALGNMDNAVESFDAAADDTGLKAFGLYHKALAFAVAGDFEASDEIFSGREAGPLRLTRRGVIAHVQVLSQLGRNADAIELMEKAFTRDLDPELAAIRDQLEADETLAFDVIRSADDGLAEVFLSVAGALNGETSDSYTLLYSRSSEYLRPDDNTEALLLSAQLLDQMEQYELAVRTYDRVQRSDPAFHAAEMGRAEALRKDDKVEAATEVLSQLAKARPDILGVHIALGDVLRGQEKWKESEEAYDKAIALFEEDLETHWIVYYARGITRERLKTWDLAETDFRKALELRPNQPQVLNYLGYSYVEMGENLDEALDMIERAVAERPDSGHITDSLGWVLYRLGRYEEAVSHMERATELLPVDPIVNDHLGDVYWAVGRQLEAQFQWKRALSFDPEEEDADRIRRKLEKGLDAVLSEEGAEPLAVVNDEG